MRGHEGADMWGSTHPVPALRVQIAAHRQPIPPGEDSWNPCCWTPLAIATHRRRCLATTEAARHATRASGFPADPPTVEEIVAVMRAIHDRADGHRLRALIVLLWRAGLRINEALALHESDLDRGRGAVLVRRGRGGKRREVGMDAWAWDQLDPWLDIRRELPIGALLCVIHGPTAGRRSDVRRAQSRRDAAPQPCSATSTSPPAAHIPQPPRGAQDFLRPSPAS